ncbi:MAG: hypothetical protein ABFD70_01645 [Syntrophaceae bacterium]|nr:hypothetical protein [Deltaproteobacteria bacterium]
MRDWYKLMAAFIILMSATVLALGGLEDLQEAHRVMLSLQNHACGDQEASFSLRDNPPCPWQLEFITIGAGEDLTGPGAPGQTGEASVSCLPGRSHPDSPGLEGQPRFRG